MIGRMRPFYQTHWDISKDIKHVWLLICTYYIAWIFQWILGDEGRGKWWDRQYRVWIPQCAAPLDVTVTYARDSFVDSPAGPFVFSRGGPDILDVTVTYARDSFCGFTGWYPGTSLTNMNTVTFLFIKMKLLWNNCIKYYPNKSDLTIRRRNQS